MDINAEQFANNLVSVMEDHVDIELKKLDQLDLLRENRLLELKREAELQKEWRAKGHGEYSEIEEREFPKTFRESSEFVVHFYKSDVPTCKIFDHHLKVLAPKHLEAKFIRINAEKAPFLVKRLGIRVIPTLLVGIGGKAKDYIVGCSDFGDREDFTTGALEWRLGVTGVIKYDEELGHPPQKGSRKSIFNKINKRTIREDESSENSD